LWTVCLPHFGPAQKVFRSFGTFTILKGERGGGKTQESGG
jgi:hypothetical protein